MLNQINLESMILSVKSILKFPFLAGILFELILCILKVLVLVAQLLNLD